MATNECLKCRDYLYSGAGFDHTNTEPWCRDCAKKYLPEYEPIRREWILSRPRLYLRQAGVPSTYLNGTFDSYQATTADQQRSLRNLKAWAKVELKGGLGLFLGGLPGTGKTHLAVSALLALCAEGDFGNFVTTQEPLLECKDSFRKDCGLKKILERCSEPLIDDLGAENPTDFARETVGILADRAYRNASN